MVNSRMRFFIMRIVIFAMLCMLLFRLFELQVVNGDKYAQITRNRMNINMIEKAPRGQIYDRYGTPLAVNRAGYSLQLIKTDMNEEDFDNMLLRLAELFEETGSKTSDSLPISEYPFEFLFEDEEEREKWFSENPYQELKNADMSAEEVMDRLIYDVYKIRSGITMDEARIICGIKYEAKITGFSSVSPLIVAEDVGAELVSAIKERKEEFLGISVVNTYYREYKNGAYASHILGRVGKLNAEEYKQYKNDRYGYSDIIGKQGVEKSAESYLRGTDGVNGIETDINGNTFTLINEVPAVSGDNVVLTIDMNMQKTAEDSLAENIRSISESGGVKTGADADAGAAVVIDVKTGDLLACASYPTYDLSSFNEDYSSLLENEAKPLWNRAVSGTYTPGSTFKPLVAIAALETGAITADEKIKDEGIYRFYEDYQPKCWIWQENKATHGSINVSSAIQNSCNYFFYETGRRVGIDIIDEYGAKFGLGEYTGVELPEEVKGNVSSPEYKKKIVKNQWDSGWFGADTLQTAIGQSYNAITPIQLANYAATIANGGTRYKVNLIKSVRSSADNSIVMENKPVVAEKIEISEGNLNAVKEGMKNVVDEGSAHAIFSGYPIKIGGKTGTAQIGKNASNNAFFIAYAPFDDPEIAVCVVIEHGVRGANAAYVARDLFDYYFGITE